MQKGFTLVEVLVVITIISIMAGVGFGALRLAAPSVQLNSSVRDLVSDLRYAQQMAVTEQVDFGVLFSISAQSYKILKHTVPAQEILSKFLPSGIIFQVVQGFSGEEAVFNSYGAAKEEGSITLQNSQAEQKVIRVRPSGFVKIQ